MTKNKEVNGYLALTIAVAFAYAAFGAITNVTSAIIPKIKETYEVSAFASQLIGAAFFIAYGVTSLPWGILMEKSSKKNILIISSTITTLGVAMFALIPGFGPNMFSMFICGVGITGVQVALNPLVAEISDPAKYSRNLTAFMVINGLGSFAAPHLVTLIKNAGYEWNVTYIVFTLLAIIMTFAVAFPKYPANMLGDIDAEARVLDVNLSKEAVEHAHDTNNFPTKNLTLDLLVSKPLIYLYAFGIFLYVGVEVGIANTIGFYLEDKLAITSVLGDAAEAAKNGAIGNYWLGLLMGRLLGSFVLDRVPGKYAIMGYISLAAISLFLVIKGDLNQALWAFPAIGFFISIMFPTIYSLCTNSFPAHYSSAISGVLCTAIIGGAVVAPVIAKVAEATQGSALVPNWDTGLLIAFGCYAYIFLVGLFSKNTK